MKLTLWGMVIAMAWLAPASMVDGKLIVGEDIYIAVEARFGTDPGHEDGITGHIFIETNDPTGCTSVSTPPQAGNSTWFAVVNRGDCMFDVKVRNAQRAGASACIVANNEAGMPVAMSADGSSDISIVAIMIEQVTGKTIRRIIADGNRYSVLATIVSSGSLSWQPFFLPCIIIFTVTVCLSIAVICYKNRQRRAMARRKTTPKTLTKKELKKLPIRPYVASECDQDALLTCRICLLEFEEGSKLRVLSCGHYFHKECVDQWLLERSQECPLCKRHALGICSASQPTERTALLDRRQLSTVMSDEEALVQAGVAEESVAVHTPDGSVATEMEPPATTDAKDDGESTDGDDYEAAAIV